MKMRILFIIFCFICLVQPQYVWEGVPSVEDTKVVSDDYKRFLEFKAPRLLEELERTLRGNPDHVSADLAARMDLAPGTSLTGTEAEVVVGVVNSFKDVVKTIKRNQLPPETVRGIFAEILSGIKDLLPELSPGPEPEVPEPVLQSDGLSYFADWPHVCKLLWYPYQAEKCGEARCLACAPAMMASAQVSDI